MNASKITTIGIVLIALFGSGIALYEHYAHQELDSRIRQSVQDQRELRRKFIVAETRFATLEASRAATTKRADRPLYDSWNGMNAKQQLEAAYSGFFKSSQPSHRNG